MKKQKGITLIALVITIIVLLILVGVTIKIVFNDGIIEKSEYAVDTYKQQAVKEKLMLAITEYKMKELAGEIEKGKIVEFLEAEGMNVDSTTDANNYVVALDGFSFKVSKNNLMVENNGTSNIPTNPPTQNPPTPPAPTVTKYTVSLTKGEGIASVSINGGTTAEVAENTEVQISAVVEDGYKFDAWVIEGGIGNINDVTGVNSKNTTVKPTGEIHLKATAREKIAYPVATVGTIVTANSTINGDEPAYDNPIIPTGFKAVNEGGVEWGTETGWDNGLVIKDGDGNEFVWVPVDGTDVKYEKVSYAGKEAQSTTDDIPTQVETWYSDSKYTNKEKGQIEDYGGFYIARYEAGTNLSTKESRNPTKEEDIPKPLSKSRKYPWNYVSYTTAKKSSEKMYANSSTYTTVQSGLITGTQWDAVMQWYGETSSSDDTSWGNYKDNYLNDIWYYSGKSGGFDYKFNYGVSSKWISISSGGGGESPGFKFRDECYLILTGGSETTKKKNIYDMAGNLYEMTTEKNSSTYRMGRGGDFAGSGSSSPAGVRADVSSNISTVGFRTVLYIVPLSAD